MSRVEWLTFSRLRGDTEPREWLRWSELWAWSQAEYPALGVWDVKQAVKAIPAGRRYGHKHYRTEHLEAVRAYAAARGLTKKTRTERDETATAPLGAAYLVTERQKERYMDFLVEDEQMQAVTHERDIVPAGVHEMTIRSAEDGESEYKRCDINPTGKCLKLKLATVSGSYRFVFHDIPVHLPWMAKQLAEALGLQPVNGRLSLDPASIAGLNVMVEISHYTSKAGKVSAVVKAYKPHAAASAAPPPATKSAAKRTATQKADAASATAKDDIPF